MPTWLIPALAGLAGLLAGKKAGGQVSSQQVGQLTANDFRALMQIPEVQEFFRLQLDQARRSNAVSQTAQQAAFSLLPRHLREGMTAPVNATPTATRVAGTGTLRRNALREDSEGWTR
jgi:hypothetical protein